MRHKYQSDLRVVSAQSVPTHRARASASSPQSSIQLESAGQRTHRMYAIAFDIDQERLQRHYPGNSPTNAYELIRRVFAAHGFARQQGSVYFGDARVVSSVTCVLAVQDLVKKHSWFKFVVSDIRMLRIEEDNDLMPAVGDYDLSLDYAKTATE